MGLLGGIIGGAINAVSPGLLGGLASKGFGGALMSMALGGPRNSLPNFLQSGQVPPQMRQMAGMLPQMANMLPQMMNQLGPQMRQIAQGMPMQGGAVRPQSNMGGRLRPNFSLGGTQNSSGLQPNGHRGAKPLNIPKNKQNLVNMIKQQAQGSGIDPNYFLKTANIESRFNPNAQSPTGAKGLFQFIRSTWNGMPGSRGLNPYNPQHNTQMAVKLAQQNSARLEKALGRKPKNHELYMAHNIGAGGALRLLKANPNAVVSRRMIGSNPRHNPKFFYDKGRPVTAARAIQKYQNEF